MIQREEGAPQRSVVSLPFLIRQNVSWEAGPQTPLQETTLDRGKCKLVEFTQCSQNADP